MTDAQDKPTNNASRSNAANAAAVSGLFGSSSAQNPKPAPKPRKPTSAGASDAATTPDAAPETRSQAKRRICREIIACAPQGLNRAQRSDHNHHANQLADRYADELLKMRADVERLRQRAEQAAAEADRLACASIEGGELLTREEQAQIISNTIKRNASTMTGADAKSLTQALRELMPDLYGADGDDKPDPVAVLAYLCTFGGRPASEIVEELGGVEFVQAQLSEILKTPVILGE